MKPIDGSAGVESTFAWRTWPASGSHANRSVNVPPTSTPTCSISLLLIAGAPGSSTLSREDQPGGDTNRRRRLVREYEIACQRVRRRPDSTAMPHRSLWLQQALDE